MITCCCFSVDNTRFATITRCGSFLVWDIASRDLLHSRQAHNYYATKACAFTADGQHLLTVQERGRREEWKIATGLWGFIAGESWVVVHCQFSRDTSRVAISYQGSYEIYVFNVYSSTAMFIVNACPEFFALSPTGRKIAFRCLTRGGIVIKDFDQGDMYVDIQGYRFASLWGTKMAVGFTDCVVIYDIYT
jgi:WD40 repeat protein